MSGNFVICLALLIVINCAPKEKIYLPNFLDKLKKGERVKVVAFGDVVTYGYGVKEGYVSLFQKALSEKYPKAKITVINAGFPGTTASKGLLRLRQDVLDHDPDLIIIAFGLSDLRAEVPVEKYSSSITSLVERVLEQKRSEILLLTPPPTTLPSSDYIIRSYRRQVLRIAQMYGIGVGDIYVAFMEKAEEKGLDSLLLDGIYPDEEGHNIFVDTLMEFF